MNEQNEKQAIEEMAKVIERTEQIAEEMVGARPSPTMYAKDLYWHGYRKQEWISVDERLPEPNLAVLIYAFFHNQWQIVKGWHSYCDKKFHIANSDYPSLTDVPVTHWMPLPEPPKMKGGAE